MYTTIILTNDTLKVDDKTPYDWYEELLLLRPKPICSRWFLELRLYYDAVGKLLTGRQTIDGVQPTLMLTVNKLKVL